MPLANGYGHSTVGHHRYGDDFVEAPPWHGSATDDDHLHAFMQRYPVDDRAQAYLCDSPPDVIARVLHEFKPKHEGESDYSGAVVAFVKRCRSGGGSDMPAKRARMQY